MTTLDPSSVAHIIYLSLFEIADMLDFISSAASSPRGLRIAGPLRFGLGFRSWKPLVLETHGSHVASEKALSLISGPIPNVLMHQGLEMQHVTQYDTMRVREDNYISFTLRIKGYSN
eukprot:3291108-Amphidinium_carterae.1